MVRLQDTDTLEEIMDKIIDALALSGHPYTWQGSQTVIIREWQGEGRLVVTVNEETDDNYVVETWSNQQSTGFFTLDTIVRWIHEDV